MKIKLSVPYFSQRKNKYRWTHDDWVPSYRKNKKDADKTPGQTGERSCNVTCLSMVLNYYNFQNITPDSIMKDVDTEGTVLNSFYTTIPNLSYVTAVNYKENKKINNPGGGTFLNPWDNVKPTYTINDFDILLNPINLAIIAQYYYLQKSLDCYFKINKEDFFNKSDNRENAIVGENLTIEEAKIILSKKIPVIVNVGFSTGTNHGHYVLLIGFDDNDAGGVFYVHDPYGDPTFGDGKLPDRVEGKSCYSVTNKYSDTGDYGKDIKIKYTEIVKYMKDCSRFYGFIALPGPLQASYCHPLHSPEENVSWMKMFSETESLKGGFYPVGRNLCSHGGIHIKASSGKSAVRAMLDGEIVGIRFLKRETDEGLRDNLFKKVSMNSVPMLSVPSYSSFVLVKHTAESKKSDSTKDKSFVFYSLYANLSPLVSNDVNWANKLSKLLKGSYISGNNGELKVVIAQKDEDKKKPGFRSGVQDSELKHLKFLENSNEQLFLYDDKDGSILTFADGFLPVSAGDIIGYSDTVSNTPINLVHCEFIAEKDSTFKDITDLLKSINNKYEPFETWQPAKQPIEVSDYLEKTEEAKNVKLEKYIAETYIPSNDLEKIYSYIYYFIDINIKQKKKITPAEYVQLYNNYPIEYPLTICIECERCFELEPDVEVTLECQALGKQCKVEKSNFVMSYEGSEETDSIKIQLGKLYNKDYKIQVPSYAEKIQVDIAGITNDFNKYSDDEKEIEFFNYMSKEKLHNYILTHQSEWTEKSLKGLIDNLKEKKQLAQDFEFKAEDFKNLIWMNNSLEKKVFGSNQPYNFNGKTSHIHPVMFLWAIKLLTESGKLSILPVKEYQKTKNAKFEWYTYYPSPASDSITRIGDTVTLYQIEKEMLPAKIDKKVTDEYGIYKETIEITEVKNYGAVDNCSFLKGIGVDKIEIAKQEILSDEVNDNKITLTYKEDKQVPRKMKGNLLFRYCLSTNGESDDWKECDKKLLIWAVQSGTCKSSIEFKANAIIREILIAISKSKEEIGDKKIYIDCSIEFYNEPYSLLEYETTKDGNTLETKAISNKVSYPSGGNHISLYSPLESVPSFSNEGLDKITFGIKEKNVFLKAALKFTNNSYLWLEDKDLNFKIKSNNSKIAGLEKSTLSIENSSDGKILAFYIPLSNELKKDDTFDIDLSFKFSEDKNKAETTDSSEVVLGTYSYKVEDIIESISLTNEAASGTVKISTKTTVPDEVTTLYELTWEGKTSNEKEVSWTRYEKFSPEQTIDGNDVLGTKLTVKLLFFDKDKKEILSNFSKQEEITCECEKSLEVRTLDHKDNSAVRIRIKPDSQASSNGSLSNKKDKVLVLDDFKEYSGFYHVEFVKSDKETLDGYLFTTWIKK